MPAQSAKLLRPNFRMFRLAAAATQPPAGLCAHPSKEVCLGVPDFLPNPIPAGAIASTAPNAEGFYLNTQETRNSRGLKQRLNQTTHESIMQVENWVKTGTDGYGLEGTDGDALDSLRPRADFAA